MKLNHLRITWNSGTAKINENGYSIRLSEQKRKKILRNVFYASYFSLCTHSCSLVELNQSKRNFFNASKSDKQYSLTKELIPCFTNSYSTFGIGAKSLCKDYTLARCKMAYNSLAQEEMCQMLIILFPGEK